MPMNIKIDCLKCGGLETVHISLGDIVSCNGIVLINSKAKCSKCGHDYRG